MRLFDLIFRTPWLIVESVLLDIQSIYLERLSREKLDIGGIEAQIGRPLRNERKDLQVVDGIAIIEVTGVIARRMSLLTDVSGGTSTEQLSNEFRQAMKDPEVRGILFVFDSPGGVAAGIEAFAEEIFAARSTKKIAAFADGNLCSAAYWLASACEVIYIASETTTVGSIGVVTAHVDRSGAEKMQGIKTTEITAGKNKRVASEYAPLTEEGRKSLEEMVKYFYNVFVGAVARNRSVSFDTALKDMADARLFYGTQAVKAGLVDKIGTFNEIMSLLTSDGALKINADAITADGGSGGSVSDGGSGSVAIIDNKTNEGEKMNYAEWKAANPEEAAKLEAEQAANMKAAADAAAAEAEKKGIEAEANRVAKIRDLTVPGMETLIDTMIADKSITPEAAAVRVVAATKAAAKGKADSLLLDDAGAGVGSGKDGGDAFAPEVGGGTPAGKGGGCLTDTALRAKWDGSPELQEEFFGVFEAYEAYVKANDAGQIQVLNKIPVKG